MKKTFIFGLMAAMLGLCACSSDDDFSDNTQKGMVLRATVEQKAETRATISDAWQFAFASSDKVSVTNPTISGNYYTFTNNGSEFTCEDAQTTAEPATWYAYFPSNEIDLTNQSGTKADVANKYALAGKSSATTGEEGLNITMSPKVAILVIKNQKGEININVKNSATTWVKGLAANADGFTVTDDTEQQNLLNVSATGTYYIAVPAGIQLAVKDGDKVIKSTDGLQAGKYYNLTIAPATKGTAKAIIGGVETDVNWVQLWKDSPKFAEYNVGASSATDTGVEISFTDATAENFTWGANWCTPSKEQMDELLKAATSDGSEKVTCQYCEYTEGDGKWGFKFTGKETGYTDNSVFFPAQSGNSDFGVAVYWSATADDSKAWFMDLFYYSGNWYSYWESRYQDYKYLVRPVLNQR